MKLREVMNQMYLTDIYRPFHPITKEYTFFSAPHGTFFKINHTLTHKTDLNRYKNISLIPCILLDNYRLRLVFNTNKTNRKLT
jgi:exonuclease III